MRHVLVGGQQRRLTASWRRAPDIDAANRLWGAENYGAAGVVLLIRRMADPQSLNLGIHVVSVLPMQADSRRPGV